MIIRGTSTYIELESGFWGIVTEDNDFLPLNMPEQLKTKGSEVECSVRIREDVMTMHNWGQPCEIISFKTI